MIVKKTAELPSFTENGNHDPGLEEDLSENTQTGKCNLAPVKAERIYSITK